MSEKNYLCVGGPLSGKRFAILYGNRFHVDIGTLSNYLYQPVGSAKPDYVEIKFACYEKHTFHTEDSQYIHMWIPEGQTGAETMNLLLESYEAAHYSKR